MKKIEIIKYFIFVNDNEAGFGEYNTLEELSESAKEFIDKVDAKIGKSTTYIGIGAEFWILEPNKEKEFGAIDFINRFVGKEKFDFCRDIKTLELELPAEVEEKLKYLIEIL